MQGQPKILVVDDSAIIRRALTKQLEQFGADVTQAEDGQQGLQRALDADFDLIISDVEMPNLDGYGFCAQLKGNPRTRGIPVIILSSLDAERDIEMGFKAGAAAYVSKSDANIHLDETVERVLAESRFHRSRLILVVDDSAIIRNLVVQALEQAGFRVMAAGNGKEALKRVEDCLPDLVISDINMPEMNGVDLCKRFHADPFLSSIPFVIMSSNSDRAVMRRLLYWGAASYLIKPFNLEQIVITVEKLLSDHFRILLKDKENLDNERKMMLASITSLIVALEARDSYTKGHSESVAGILAAMGSLMGTDPDDIDTLRIAGRLHDIGKIGVPDHVLLKPGRLTDDEFAVIKSHPTIGSSILGAIPSMQPILPVIVHHHERFDGKGYPSGLKGASIPLWARMTAVADTYDALTSNRPYRQGIRHADAMSIIEDVRGTQLCPDCVDVFKRLPECSPGNSGK